MRYTKDQLVGRHGVIRTKASRKMQANSLRKLIGKKESSSDLTKLGNPKMVKKSIKEHHDLIRSKVNIRNLRARRLNQDRLSQQGKLNSLLHDKWGKRKSVDARPKQAATGHAIITTPRGASYYLLNGKKIYVSKGNIGSKKSNKGKR